MGRGGHQQTVKLCGLQSVNFKWFQSFALPLKHVECTDLNAWGPARGAKMSFSLSICIFSV